MANEAEQLAQSRYRMSQKRYDDLIEQLKYLETDEMNDVNESLKEAKSFGDLSENSEYDAAKDRQAKLFAKIADTKDLIDNAIIVESSVKKTVRVRDIELDEEMLFEIVTSAEANLIEGKISDDSPLGLALGNLDERKPGDIVVAMAPGGKFEYELLEVILSDFGEMSK